MIEKNTLQKIAEVFFDQPSRQFHLRELSRLTKLSLPSIITATDKLAQEKIITKTKGSLLTTVTANREQSTFVWRKRLFNLEKMYLSGLIKFLDHQYHHPPAIILFGSFSRGEDTERSDIDLAVLGRNEKPLSLETFEKNLKKRISLHFIKRDEISEEFKANLANGIVLEGSW
ncbi:MAG TPA: nucleotidyltransferase domain-containing protein [Candidatus Nanoarchaeia archaeon]|nr:nucleotidyltransferase domain-containing protein [Candidatus Nanoarchaeia archaeon]